MANSPYQNLWNFQPQLDPRYQRRMAQQAMPMESVMPQQNPYQLQAPSLASQIGNTLASSAVKQGLKYGLDYAGNATGLTGEGSALSGLTGSAGGIGSTLSSVALPLAGAAGAYNIGSHLLKNKQQNPLSGAMSGAAAGALAGSWFPVVGTAIGGVLGGLGGLATSFMGRGQHKDEIARDSVRSGMKDSGFLDKGDYLTLDGKQYGNFRMDGSTPGYNIDFNNANAGKTVGDIQGLGAILSGNTGKSAQDTTGYLSNAIMGGASAKSMYDKFGGQGKAFDAINQMVAQGAMTQDQARIYQHGINNVYGQEWGTGRNTRVNNQAKPIVSNIVPKPAVTQPTSATQKLANAITAKPQIQTPQRQSIGGFFG